ncbi:MAG TPA: alpha-amylase family glycosyl hydrolase [Longimicrobiales bacterium]|nr:alpha-amylase family glycosyl hydrolase [Longimicrobiales bacterium]
MRFRRAVALLPVLAFAACAAATPRATRDSTSGADWIARSAIYEVFVRDFSPEGDFRGVIAGLDRIEAVGANVIWLMPIHPIGELNRKGPLGSAYSGRDYRAINPDFGTEADLHELVAAAHARGLRVILDWVPNHTAWDHVWLRDHPAWYVRDDSGRVSVPRDLEGNLTDWTDVAQLDYGNPALRAAMIDAMRYWLQEFDIDGFRVDVAGFIPADFYREAIPQLRAAGADLLLAEWGDLAMHELGFDLTYAWSSYARLKEVWKGGSAGRFIAAELEELGAMPAGGLRLRFSTNHDETAWDAPPVELFGGAAGARAAFAAMALLPGPPLIYNGQEVESPQRLGLFVKEPVEWDQPGANEARAFYRRVIDLSRTHPAFAGRAVTAVQTDAPDDVIAYRRGGAIVLVNPRPRPLRVQLTDVRVNGARELLYGGSLQGEAVVLQAHGALVLELGR